MKELTLEEFQQALNKASKITLAGHSKSITRHGSYVSLITGLKTQLIFYGLNLENDTFVIEVVG